MKLYKKDKRRHAGKLSKITEADREKKRLHDERTGRKERVFTRKKVIPTESGVKD